MKKVLITALCLVMVGSVLLSAAGPNGPKGPKYVQIFGVITGITEDPDGVYTIDIDYQELDVLVTGETVVMECGELIEAGPAYLDVGDFVKVRWVIGEEVADKVNILCELPELGL